MDERALLVVTGCVPRPRSGQAGRALCLAAALLLLPAGPAGAICVALLCSSDVSVSNDPNQCGAVANYAAPTPVVVSIGDCGTIVCAPASGSFFPVGTVEITCTATAGPSCSFGVTVFDTQPPQITVPTSTSVGTTPGEPLVVNFPPPGASDNCPGVVTNCDPPSGSAFPGGQTDVTCTATDASGNTATGELLLRVFDACVQDDASGEFVRWSTGDGVYEVFDCDDSACGAAGFARGGTGEAKPTPGGFSLVDREDDRSVRASLGLAKGKGKASLKFQTGSTRLSSKLKDSAFADDSCSCP